MNQTRTLVKEKSGVRRRVSLRGRDVYSVLLNKRGQITLPTHALKRLGIHAGEELELVEEKKALVLVPRKKIPKSQAWYYTPEWQQMMQEAFDDLKHGRMVGPFDSVDDFIKELHLPIRRI